jgi:hypothetical protein
VSDPEWFAPKRYGYGAGLPISWQGWALTSAFLVLVGLAALLIRHSLVGYISVIAVLTAAFIVICARTTRGGWRWRWGEKD